MKFGTRTLQILKNFNSINSSIEFTAGNQIATMATSKAIIAVAKIEETIEKTFCVYDLSKFLSTLSLFDDYTIEYHDKYLTISNGSNVANYYFADSTLITKPPKTELTFPSVEVKLNLTSEQFGAIQKASDVLSLPEIAFIGENSRVKVASVDSKGVVADNFSIDLGETDNEFKAIFKKENLKLLVDNYEVEISKAGISSFKSKDMTYYVAVESKVSTF